MARGGARPGAGRKPGTKSKTTREREQAAKLAAAKVAEAMPGAFEGDAHALLMMVYKDPNQDMSLRLDAAKAAIRFEKPALAAVNHSGHIDVTADQADDNTLAAIALTGSPGLPKPH